MKSGFVAIIGRSNVGKSTLINTLVGTKVAITTPKPQTTRQPIHGVMTTDEGQVVFIDTPGIMQKAKDALTQKLLAWTKESLKEVDIVLYIADATRDIREEEKQVLKMMDRIEKPKLLVINKIDDRSSRKYIDTYRDLFKDFDGMVEVSALNGTNVDLLRRWVFEHLPEGPYMYPDFAVSNMTKEQQIAELIREKLFLRLREEVPYTTHVEVTEITQKDKDTVYIKAIIYTNDERYKSMIIGAGGRGIKEIGQSTRKELEFISDQKVFLDLNVQTDRDWLRRLGE